MRVAVFVTFLSLPLAVDGLVAPSARLLDLHASLFAKVEAAIPLQATDYTEVCGGDKHSRGSATWYGEVSPNYLTGLSKYVCGSGVGLDAWMGPSYDVPHCLLQVTEEDGDKYAVRSDLISRGATPIGSDPQIVEKYYEPMVKWHSDAMKLPGASALPPSSSFSKRLLYSPVQLGVGGLKFDDAKAVAEAHYDFWLGSVQEAQQVPARLRGSFNLR